MITPSDADEFKKTASFDNTMSPRVAGRPLLLGLVAALFLALSSVRVVAPAHVGVVSTFGRVAPDVLNSGLHITNPFAEVLSFSTKTQLLEQQNHVPTKEGLTVDLDVAVLFRAGASSVRDIYLGLGANYVSVLVQPELSSAVRGLTSEADAKALYTSGRLEMQKKLKSELVASLQPRGIIVEDVLLKAVRLPELLTQAIERKAQAEQESARMEFVLTKEKQEAERKGVEAKGIADFQRIVSEGISPALLQWKGIEATEKLAASTNSKMVIMGNGKDSLPVLLGASADGGTTEPPSHRRQQGGRTPVAAAAAVSS